MTTGLRGSRSKRACVQGFRGYFAVRGELLRQLIQVHFVVLDPVERGKTFTTHKRQAAEERQVAALVIQAGAAAGTRALAFGAAAGGLTLARGDAAPTRLRYFFDPS